MTNLDVTTNFNSVIKQITISYLPLIICILGVSIIFSPVPGVAGGPGSGMYQPPWQRDLGNVQVRYEDGKKIYIYPDGTRKTIIYDMYGRRVETRVEEPDGTISRHFPNGSNILVLPDGTKITNLSDGTSTEETEDGIKVSLPYSPEENEDENNMTDDSQDSKTGKNKGNKNPKDEKLNNKKAGHKAQPDKKRNSKKAQKGQTLDSRKQAMSRLRSSRDIIKKVNKTGKMQPSGSTINPNANNIVKAVNTRYTIENRLGTSSVLNRNSNIRTQDNNTANNESHSSQFNNRVNVNSTDVNNKFNTTKQKIRSMKFKSNNKESFRSDNNSGYKKHLSK